MTYLEILWPSEDGLHRGCSIFLPLGDFLLVLQACYVVVVKGKNHIPTSLIEIVNTGSEKIKNNVENILSGVPDP
jgi:hypothetical protein